MSPYAQAVCGPRSPAEFKPDWAVSCAMGGQVPLIQTRRQASQTGQAMGDRLTISLMHETDSPRDSIILLCALACGQLDVHDKQTIV